MKGNEGLKAETAQFDPLTIDAVPHWIEKMGSSGMVTSSVRRNWATAMRRNESRRFAALAMCTRDPATILSGRYRTRRTARCEASS